jgi:hypothetical protein
VGFFEGKKKMVADAYHHFSRIARRTDNINARLGSGSLYLRAVLVPITFAHPRLNFFAANALMKKKIIKSK